MCAAAADNWGALRPGNSVDAFKAAYRHVVTVLRSYDPPFSYQLSYNVKSANNDARPLKDFYVGDEYTDEICISIYNFSGELWVHVIKTGLQQQCDMLVHSY